METYHGLKDKGGEWQLEMGRMEQVSPRLVLARRKQVEGLDQLHVLSEKCLSWRHMQVPQGL